MSAGLFVSDIDGTLVNPDKAVTPAAVAAAQALKAAGVPFTVVSARPPRGMATVAAAVGVELPFAAFNGGAIVRPDGGLVEFHPIDAIAARRALALIDQHGVDAFVFADDAWLVRDGEGPHIARERHTVGFDPTVVDGFEAMIGRIGKLVAVSDDAGLLDTLETELRAALGDGANVARSQTYYVDVTHPLANKGDAVKRLAEIVHAALADTVVIGDMGNDVAMFEVAGFSIAMGQAPAAVKAAASAVTGANTEDGWAQAVRDLVLPRLAQAPAGEGVAHG